MKRAIAILALIVLVIPDMKGQSLSYSQSSNETSIATSTFSNTSFVNYHGHKRLNKKMLWGGILAGSGGLTALFGGICYSWGDGDGTSKRPPSKSLHSFGTTCVIVGGAVAVTGFVLLISGRMERNRGYGFELIAPKPNEIGFAYNFR
jgi:hypothetical protein